LVFLFSIKLLARPVSKDTNHWITEIETFLRDCASSTLKSNIKYEAIMEILTFDNLEEDEVQKHINWVNKNLQDVDFKMDNQTKKKILSFYKEASQLIIKHLGNSITFDSSVVRKHFPYLRYTPLGEI